MSASAPPAQKEMMVETAFDWLLRSRELALSAAALMDGTPRAAADAFLCRRSRRGTHRRSRRGTTDTEKRPRGGGGGGHGDGDGDGGDDPPTCPTGGGVVAGGTGISLVDEILRHGAEAGDAHSQPGRGHRRRVARAGPPGTVVLEVSGGRGTGKTSLLLGLASSYLAATMPPEDDGDDGGDRDRDRVDPGDPGSSCRHYGAPPALDAPGAGGKGGRGGRKERSACGPNALPPPPSVIFLDCEHGLRVPQLVSSVRASLLRAMRRRGSPRKRRRRGRSSGDGGDDDDADDRGAPPNVDDEGGDDALDDDADRLEDGVARNLGRVHVAWPRTDGDLTAVMEQIGHALRVAREGASSFSIAASAPTMVVIDSVNSFERRDGMTNATSGDQHGGSVGGGGGAPTTGGGGGTRADFLRQLNRLLADHPGTIVLASRVLFHPGGGGSNREGFGGGGRGKDPWNRTVTHRVALERVAEGTAEQGEGFEFVAASERPRLIVPFSVASGGIFC